MNFISPSSASILTKRNAVVPYSKSPAFGDIQFGIVNGMILIWISDCLRDRFSKTQADAASTSGIDNSNSTVKFNSKINQNGTSLFKFYCVELAVKYRLNLFITTKEIWRFSSFWLQTTLVAGRYSRTRLSRLAFL